MSEVGFIEDHAAYLLWAINEFRRKHIFRGIFFPFLYIFHRMKILLSVNWNISECPLNVYGMFTEIRISGIVQWPFSDLTVRYWMAGTFKWPSSNSFSYSKIVHQIRGFKVILLWNTTHEIIINEKKSCPRAGSNPIILLLAIITVRFLLFLFNNFVSNSWISLTLVIPKLSN